MKLNSKESMIIEYSSGKEGGCNVKLLIDGKEKTLSTKTDTGKEHFLHFSLFSNVLKNFNTILKNIHFQTQFPACKTSFSSWQRVRKRTQLKPSKRLVR